MNLLCDNISTAIEQKGQQQISTNDYIIWNGLETNELYFVGKRTFRINMASLDRETEILPTNCR